MKTSFRSVPSYAGSIEYASGAKATYSIAIAEGLVAHQGDAWTHALKLAGGYMNRIVEGRASLNPMPPSFLGVHIFHQEYQCMLFFPSFSPHQNLAMAAKIALMIPFGILKTDIA